MITKGPFISYQSVADLCKIRIHLIVKFISPWSDCRAVGSLFVSDCPVMSLTFFHRNELSLFSLMAFSKKAFWAVRMRLFVLLRQSLNYFQSCFL